MEKCDCYRESVCYGTKGCQPCSCGGDMAQCDFYPEKRQHCCDEYRTMDGACAHREGPLTCPVVGDAWRCPLTATENVEVKVADIDKPNKNGTVISMNTAEMWLAAQQNGKTYCTGDMAYSAGRGLYDLCDDATWPLYAFNSVDELMDYEWVELKTMTRAEAEKKLHARIID